jgi:hypothetical protein
VQQLLDARVLRAGDVGQRFAPPQRLQGVNVLSAQHLQRTKCVELDVQVGNESGMFEPRLEKLG